MKYNNMRLFQMIIPKTFGFRGAGFIMNRAVQMDPPYFAIKEAVKGIIHPFIITVSVTGVCAASMYR